MSSVTAQLVTGAPLVLYLVGLVGPINWEWRRQLNMFTASVVGYLATLGVIHLIGGAASLLPGILAGCGAFLLTASIVPVIGRDDAEWMLGLTNGRGASLIGRAGGLFRR
jgi:hypothetical protein